MRIASYILVLFLVVLTSCREGGSRLLRMSDDPVAKQLFQGVWLDDSSDMPVFLVEGDSIHYTDPNAIPVAFKIIRDSIYFLGQDTIAYKIMRQGENTFWMQTDTEEVMKLYRSEDENDELAFHPDQSVEMLSVIQEKMEKDSIIMFNDVRYRGYVFINPTKYKVVRTMYDEMGIGFERVYYDNIIHICVYQGAQELYGRDVNKQLFADFIEPEVLSSVILSDMDFMGVDEDGYHYRAILTVPDTFVSYYMNLNISPQGQLNIVTEQS